MWTLTSSLVGIVVSWFPASAKGVGLPTTCIRLETREHVDEDAVLGTRGNKATREYTTRKLIDPRVINALDMIARRVQNGHVCSGLMSHGHERQAFCIL